MHAEEFEQRLLQHFQQFPPVTPETVLLVARHWLRVDAGVALQAIRSGKLPVRTQPGEAASRSPA